MSAKGGAKIVAAQKKRWAKIKSGKGSSKAAAPKKKGMSAAHKAKLKAAAMKRWPAIRAGKAPNPFVSKG
jgi:hypothetical protein